MTSTEFAWYLVGIRDSVAKGSVPSPEQWAAICAALETVFHKVTPKQSSLPGYCVKDMKFSNDPQPPVPFKEYEEGTLLKILSTSRSC